MQEKSKKLKIAGVARLRLGTPTGAATLLQEGDIITMDFDKEPNHVLIRVSRPQQLPTNDIVFSKTMSLWKSDEQQAYSMKDAPELVIPYKVDQHGALLDMISAFSGLRLIPTDAVRQGLYRYVCSSHPSP
ncbi:MAG: hypothetical protein ABIO72_02280 [Patescibacteria group bacterium]